VGSTLAFLVAQVKSFLSCVSSGVHQGFDHLHGLFIGACFLIVWIRRDRLKSKSSTAFSGSVSLVYLNEAACSLSTVEPISFLISSSITAFGLPSTFQVIFPQLGEGLAVTYGAEVIEVTMAVWSEPE